MRIIQRCPEFLPKMFEPWLHDPSRTLLLTHPNGLTPSAETSRIYRNQREHDPLDIHRAREIASSEDPIPVGILYQNPEVPCYEDLRGAGRTAHRRSASAPGSTPSSTRSRSGRTKRRPVPPDAVRDSTTTERPAMDMAAKFQEQLVFHMTGKRGDGLAAVDVGALRPALLAPYRDLTRLRYDFPLVLAEPRTGAEPVHSLSALVSQLLVDIAPRGVEGERLRKHVLRLEQELRAMLAGGMRGTLSELWRTAATRLGRATDPATAEVLVEAASSLAVDGELADCDAALPARLLQHEYAAAQRRKAREFRALTDDLMRKLSDIRRAAFAHSQAGQEPAALAAAIGSAHADVFDFAVMSKLVRRGAPKDELPAGRRRRIEWALDVLRSQPFYADDDAPTGVEHFDFVFDNCAAAAAAWRVRLPRLTEVVKAISIAELESSGAYVEADHDAFFERYDEGALTADDLALFPDYLVCIPAAHNDAPENAGLIDMLSAGLPVKVLVEQTDLLEEASIGTGHFAFGVRSARLATTAMGLGGMFVLQATSADLLALRERVGRGLACRGPALFSIFSGSPAAAGDLPAYLTAAAARESRAFPAFAYDATGGDNWATRYSLGHNRNADADWPRDQVEYADEALQRVVEEVAFTYVDFALTDRRYARALRGGAARALGCRHAAGGRLAAAAREVGGRPRALRVGGRHRGPAVARDRRRPAHAIGAPLPAAVAPAAGARGHPRLARRAAAGDRAGRVGSREGTGCGGAGMAPAATAPAAPATATASAAAATAADAVVEAAAPPSDEPWIETSRCPSCNECQTINDKMFGYNENKQAFIKDLKAGTYRQMVEAAETCQVAIIHPGKPWNPAEAGLPELMERAKPFM